MRKSDLALAIETSGRTGSVAICQNQGQIDEITFSGFMKHSAELFPAIQKLLNNAGFSAQDITQVYVTAGPGSFTGLRIAVTAAKMFNLSLHTPIVALDSLDVIAENALEYSLQSGSQIENLAVVLDAKKDYFFAALYRINPSGWDKILAASMITADELLDKLKQTGQTYMLGEGLVYHKNSFEAPFIKFLDSKYWQPQARNLFRLGRLKALQNNFADPAALTPLYIRKPDAVEKSQK